MNKNFEFTYETSGNSSYISTVLDEGVINYQLEMITNNSIKNILEARKIRQNNSIKLSYNITSKVSLEYMLGRGKISRKGFFSLLKGLIDAYDDIREYQLVNTGILLDKKYIYINPNTFEPQFLYMPVYDSDSGLEALRSFFNSLILEGCIEVSNDNYIQIFLETINAKEINISKLKEFLSKYRNQTRAADIPPVQSAPPVQPVAHQSNEAPAAAAQTPPPIKRPEIQSSRNEEKKVNTPSAEEKKKADKSGIIKFGLVQIGIIVLIIGLFTQGILIGADGKLKAESVIGALVLIGALDALAFKYMVLVGKENGGKKVQTVKEKQKPAPAAKKDIKIPGAVPAVNTKPSADTAAQPQKPAPAAAQVQSGVYASPVQLDGGDDATICDDAYDMDKTEVISDAECPYLVYFDNGLPIKIRLEKARTVVGRQRSSVDAVISNGQISKIHAEFILRDSGCFVIDCNSQNGTYINDGPRIPANTEYEIKSGDKIRLAKIEMVLNMV